MDEILCREASAADLSNVLRLYEQPDLDDGKALSLAQAEHIFDLMHQYPDFKVYVSVDSGKIVGTFTLLIMHNLAHLGSPSAIIEDVAVDPESQGRGVGTTVMKYALKLAADKRCYRAVISSNMKRERAHAFYSHLGFERHGYSFRISI